MNRMIVMLLAGIVASALLSTAAPAAAQTNLAVLDTQFVVQMSEVGKSLRAQAERQRGSDDRLVKSEEDNLVKLEQALTQQRATLAADEYQKRVQELRKKNATSSAMTRIGKRGWKSATATRLLRSRP